MESPVRTGRRKRGQSLASVAPEPLSLPAISTDGPSDADPKTTLRTPASLLPSPVLTPNDPTRTQLLPERTPVSSPTKGVPTPDPSSDSQSDDAEPSRDDFSLPNAAATQSKPQSSREAIPGVSKTRSRSSTKTSNDGIRRLSASKMQELAAAPDSLPVATIPDRDMPEHPLTAGFAESASRAELLEPAPIGLVLVDQTEFLRYDGAGSRYDGTHSRGGRPSLAARTLSTPPMGRRKSSSQPPAQPSSARRNSFNPAPRPAALDLDGRGSAPPSAVPPPQSQAPAAGPADSRPPSPIPPSIPLPPMSIPTILQLELAGQRPSPLYIHHSYANDMPYESNAVKMERVWNFLSVFPHMERAMTFGVLACLDAWLWTFTVLPMRFCIAVSVLVQWWAYVVVKEVRSVLGFVWDGLGRMWRRRSRGRSPSVSSSTSGRTESRSRSRAPEAASATATGAAPRRPENLHASRQRPSQTRRVSGKPAGTTIRQHRRTKSNPSKLTPFHKADMLQGAIIICASLVLMHLDASRVYHYIRAQSAIKLYALYNLVEVGDRLLSAIGQDVLECLFSEEMLSRNSSGRSRVGMPLLLFFGSLLYTIIHSMVLFYQVTALNVAVNSYSNALITLLMSNQFVEIKSSVFKKFEKENTFQLLCADIVERFQLWIMLIIIATRNIIEVGGLSVPGAGTEDGSGSGFPIHVPSILPASFTILPSWLWSGEVLSPFFVVIGSEIAVDYIKHAYIGKFNNIRPTFYNKVLDILCKDYYTNAFVTPSLTRRLGLPVLPLSCLFIRSSVQAYNMFLAAHMPTPLPPSSSQTELSVESLAATPSPALAAAFDRLDNLLRNALGRAAYGFPYEATSPGDEGYGSATRLWLNWTSDDVIAALTMVVVFLLMFLVLLVVKLLLGMVLLWYSRGRYAKMKAQEHAEATGAAERESFDTKGKRVGGHAQVELGEERKRWIYSDDPEGLKKAKEREKRTEKNLEKSKERGFGHVTRYEMSGRRIW